jgi:hypothetical protein
MKKIFVLAGAALVILIGACERGSHSNGTRPTPAERSVVVYSSADKEFAELVFSAYEKSSGVKVLPV